MLKQHQQIADAIKTVQSFADRNGLKVESPAGRPYDDPQIFLKDGASNTVVSLTFATRRCLSLRGLTDKVYLYKTAMFDYWNYGTYAMDTKAGRNRLQGFLSRQLTEYISKKRMFAANAVTRNFLPKGFE